MHNPMANFLEDYRPFEGRLTVAQVCAKTGRIYKYETNKNIITFRAADVMAKRLGDDNSFQISHLIAGGDTTTPGVFPAVARTDTELDPITDPGIDPARVRVELPVVSPSFSVIASPSAPAGLQQHNVVTFTAIMPALPGPGDPAFNGKEFFEAGLIARVGSDDILFNHLFHSGVEKLEDFQLVYTWAIRFL